MSIERNKAAIRRLYQEVVNEGNLDALEEVFAYDVEVNTSAIPEDPEPEYGFERLKPAFMRMREAFPGLHAAIDDLFGEGDRVVARVHFYGHLPGEPDAPEGKRRLWTSVDVFRMYDGKVAEQFGSQDNVRLLRETGVVPLEVTSPLSAGPGGRRGIDSFSREGQP